MAAHPVAPSMTADEFIRLYGEDDDNRLELIEGEIYEPPVNGYAHDRTKNVILKLLDRAGVEAHGFEAWIEHSFKVSKSGIMTPDVAVIRRERLMNRTGNSATDGAPDIAFEVAISDKSLVLQRKIRAYLNNGAHAVCCAYPDLKTIVVYSAREWRELTEDDVLEFPALLPGIAIPVSAIFEGL